jgi:two-component system, chemotaxis family, chemotaxis protein CheY
MRLMVVDDSSVMRRAIQRYASSLDLEVVGTAKDGEEALVLFRKQTPDVVTLDITMPKMDGLSTLKAMLAEHPGTRVLVVTALSDSATGIQALRLGAKGFLNKPFTESELTEELKHVMDS